ncbi:MAG: HNH endonuclease [Candidatus Peregrinibacteria bacterium]|nr:HNH endonuclease [Candidatus Peregrinibacteria bacterium]
MIKYKKINNYDYYVSSNGDVFSSKRNKLLKQETTTRGYKRVSLSTNGKVKRIMVHRLVSEYFIENTYNKPQVNHKNGIKHDNKVENLEWVTASENVNHAYKAGITKPLKGSSHRNSKLDSIKVLTIKTMLMSGFKQKKLAEHYNVNQSIISDVNTKTSWKHLNV